MKNNSIYQKFSRLLYFARTESSPFYQTKRPSMPQPELGTAAAVTLGGRITNAKDRGIGNVRVTLVDTKRNARVAVTNSFDYYQFTQIQAGQSVVISVKSKNFVFANPTQAVFAANDVGEINFAAHSNL